MVSIILLIISILISRFNVGDSVNQRHDVCSPSIDANACDNVCENIGSSNSRCDRIGNEFRGAVGCNHECECECTYMDPLLNNAAVSIPFEIKHTSSGQCLHWDSEIDRIILNGCNGGSRQKWLYYPSNGALVSTAESNNGGCLESPRARTNIGHELAIWSNRECVDWEQSQWTFLANGHIQSQISHSLYIDMNQNGDGNAEFQEYGNTNEQIFSFPDGTLPGSAGLESCEINRLQLVAEESTNEFAQTAWNLGRTIAGMIPKVGSIVTIIASVWSPFDEENNDWQMALTNSIFDKVEQLQDCLDASIVNLRQEWIKSDQQDYVGEIMNDLDSIMRISGQDRNERITFAFSKFDAWIGSQLFRTRSRDNFLDYENEIPIYESMYPLWSVVSQEMLLVVLNDNDCGNYDPFRGIIRDNFETMKTWIINAIDSILHNSIQIISDDNRYEQWELSQQDMFYKQYVEPINYYIEAIDDISPHLLSCTVDGDFKVTDNIIDIYKYTRNSPYGSTLSVSDSSEIITSRGFILDTSVSYKLYDEPTENTLPVYKKYKIESDNYLITLDADERKYDDYITVSVLGYCSTLIDNSPISSCDDIEKFADQLISEGTLRFTFSSGCLTVDSSNNNNAHFSGCNGNDNQIWQIWGVRGLDSDGFDTIISKDNNLCLYADYQSSNDNIYTTKCDGDNDDQRWRITGESIINGAKRIDYQNCVDADLPDSYDNARAVRCIGNNNQKITFSQESTIRTIGEVHKNQCVKVEPGNGGNVIRDDCIGDINERWRLKDIDNDGFYTLISLFNNNCLHVTPNENPVFADNRNDNTVNAGDRIISSPCNNNNPNQRWKIDGNIIRNKANGQNYCLDVNREDRADVIVRTCDANNDNQMIVLPGFSSLSSN